MEKDTVKQTGGEGRQLTDSDRRQIDFPLYLFFIIFYPLFA
jgi:hypothetical protein